MSNALLYAIQSRLNKWSKKSSYPAHRAITSWKNSVGRNVNRFQRPYVFTCKTDSHLVKWFCKPILTNAGFYLPFSDQHSSSSDRHSSMLLQHRSIILF